MLKKIIATSLFTVLIGCSAVEQSYDSIKLGQVFDSEFAYTIEQRNTLEDNKILLKSIENNQELYSLLLKNKDKSSPNHKYYLEYMILKNKIAQDEFVKNKKEEAEILSHKGLLKDAKEALLKRELDKEEEKVEKALIKEEKEKNVKTIKNEPKKDKSIEKKLDNSKLDKDNVLTNKETVKKKEKPIVINKNDVVKHSDQELNKSFYFVDDKLKHDLLIMQTHCNEEDAHLLVDDINSIKEKIKALIKNDTEKYDFIMSKYHSDFESCLVFFKNNELLNPPSVEDK